MKETDIARVVQIFEQSGARWSLVGAHAVGLVTEPRATTDFDFVVEDRKVRRVVDALQAEFGELDVDDIGVAVRLRALDVDLIRAIHPLFKEALARTRRIDDWNVPTTEVPIVLKFLAAVSPWRGPDCSLFAGYVCTGGGGTYCEPGPCGADDDCGGLQCTPEGVCGSFCISDEDCFGYGVCNPETGACECTSDDECVEGTSCSAPP